MSWFTSITGLVVALGSTFLPDVLLPTSQPPRQAQGAPPVFRVAVNYVESDVIVRDSKTGQFVRSLHAEDFDVLEDGRPQQIATFALVDLSAGDGSPSPDTQPSFLARPCLRCLQMTTRRRVACTCRPR